jgi:hypothetical protein
MRRSYWRKPPTFTYLRSVRLASRKACVRRIHGEHEGSDFDEARAEAKREELDQSEDWIYR